MPASARRRHCSIARSTLVALPRDQQEPGGVVNTTSSIFETGDCSRPECAGSESSCTHPQTCTAVPRFRALISRPPFPGIGQVLKIRGRHTAAELCWPRSSKHPFGSHTQNSGTPVLAFQLLDVLASPWTVNMQLLSGAVKPPPAAAVFERRGAMKSSGGSADLAAFDVPARQFAARCQWSRRLRAGGAAGSRAVHLATNRRAPSGKRYEAVGVADFEYRPEPTLLRRQQLQLASTVCTTDSSVTARPTAISPLKDHAPPCRDNRGQPHLWSSLA